MPEANTPILVGGGQFTQKGVAIADLLSPMQIMAEAAKRALADAKGGDALAKALDTVAVVRFTADSPEAGGLPKNQYPNAPRTLANAIGAKPARELYTATGGNTPQWLVNRTAEEIANGETDCALLAGSEALGGLLAAVTQGQVPDWGDNPGGEPTQIGVEKPGVNEMEHRHAMYFPVNTYPLFENAIRGELGRSVKDHQLELGKLFSRFTEVAATNPYAWFPTFRSPEEIATETDKNRYVGFPYTKYLNSIIRVDQAAALIMMSVGKARELGIPEDRWVYLHGCGDANDLWYVSERVNFHSSPAIRTMGRKALDMAGMSVSDIDYFDLYSCFPSAVEIGAQELGLALDDPRGFTVTGGLPYFGGPGNNYVMHSIATMLDKLRAKPGTKGLCTANGWFVTKHSIGIYSTEPKEGAWERENPATYQAELDAMDHPVVDDLPEGEGKIETYTVVHGRQGAQFGLVVGRKTDTGHRFVAHVPNDPALFETMKQHEMLGVVGTVEPGKPNEKGALGPNIFTPKI
ncbi:acetyl-CoA acetyltransferase [Pyruvatibacter mobilis]|uniref:acetyl-CoA acetyltransferase n=1 Tax=Pyruvatibacter mobilis TaxID=1712261 RepID=UPI003BB1C2A6